MPSTLAQRLEEQTPLIADLLRISGAPGLPVGVFHDNRIIHTLHVGQRSIDSQEPPNNDTVYYAASSFKIVMACAIAKLVADERLQWNTPVRNYLPGLRRHDDL
jgi:CubicO group peptidase (beta-lactamase class C family)